MTPGRTFDHLLETIGHDGLTALVHEGLRRRMPVKAIAQHLNIPVGNAGFYAVGHENIFPLRPGERVRHLAKHWLGTVINQAGETVRILIDGTPKTAEVGIVAVARHDLELTSEPELLPAGATFNEDGCLSIPCEVSPSGKQLEFYCPHCRSTHRHGNPIHGGTSYRTPHCHKPGSPLNARGDIFLVPKPRSIQ